MQTLYKSNIISSVLFENLETVDKFDEMINSKEYYISCANKLIENYYESWFKDNKPVFKAKFVNGKIELELDDYYMTLSEHIIDMLEDESLYDSVFENLVEDIADSTEEGFDNVKYYIIDKIKEFSKEIDSLLEFKIVK